MTEAEELTAAHKYLDELSVGRTTDKGSVLPLWYRVSLLREHVLARQINVEDLPAPNWEAPGPNRGGLSG